MTDLIALVDRFASEPERWRHLVSHRADARTYEHLHRDDSLFALSVPLPGHHIINASTTTELERRPRVGDHVSIVEEIVSVSPQKTTRIGAGVFITSLTTYSDQHGEVIARNTNVLFRYENTDTSAETEEEA